MSCDMKSEMQILSQESLSLTYLADGFTVIHPHGLCYISSSWLVGEMTQLAYLHRYEGNCSVTAK